MITTNVHRIFFALWPDDEVRRQTVHNLKKSPHYKINGYNLPPSNLHITLHFIGNISSEKLHCLHQQAEKVSSKKFAMEFNHFGYFPKPKIIWMGLTDIPDALTTLHHNLANNLQSCGYNAEQREFIPHMSLIRKAEQPDKLIDFDPICWQANDFVLVESLPVNEGVKYKVLQRYPLI